MTSISLQDQTYRPSLIEMKTMVGSLVHEHSKSLLQSNITIFQNKTNNRQRSEIPRKMSAFKGNDQQQNRLMVHGLEKPIVQIDDKNSAEIEEGDRDYQVLDLTYTLILQEFYLILILTLFIVLLALRYYTLGCLIWIIYKTPNNWEWIFVILATRFLYFVIVLKISLKTPETKTQIILKTHWNSKESDVNELFEIIDTRKLLTSICRAIIPPQLSFVYIRSSSKKKRVDIFAAVNYIYASIEALIYYPFFIIYCALLNPDNNYALNVINPNFTIFLASMGEIMLLSLSVYLLLKGYKKRHGTLMYRFWIRNK